MLSQHLLGAANGKEKKNWGSWSSYGAQVFIDQSREVCLDSVYLSVWLHVSMGGELSAIDMYCQHRWEKKV